jgi:hypothetical protein
MKIQNTKLRIMFLPLAFIMCSEQERLREHREKTLQKSPVQITYKDLNNDNIEDRILSSQAGFCQEQYGIINPKTNQIDYLTLEQIIQRARENYDSDISKLTKKYSHKKQILHEIKN